MTAILTDEQIVTLLATDGGREEMLQEAARMGAMKAADMCDVIASDYGGVRESPIHTDFGKALGEAKAVGAHNCGVAIRAAVSTEAKPQ